MRIEEVTRVDWDRNGLCSEREYAIWCPVACEVLVIDLCGFSGDLSPLSFIYAIKSDLVLHLRQKNDILNDAFLDFLDKLDRLCLSDVKLHICSSFWMTNSDWRWFVENIVNGFRYRFNTMLLPIKVSEDIVLDLNTKRNLYLNLMFPSPAHDITLRGKANVLQFSSVNEHIRVECKFTDITDYSGNSIISQVMDYDSLPELYE